MNIKGIVNEYKRYGTYEYEYHNKIYLLYIEFIKNKIHSKMCGF